MTNQQNEEIIAILNSAISLVNSSSDAISNREKAEEINKLSVQLREAIQSKMPVTHKSFLDIN
ncbi:hypothetical protein [Lelliottia nimipressuralis]